MTTELSVMGVVKETHEILKSVRKNVVTLMQNLYFLRENYDDADQTFGSYVEEEFGLSQSYASKLCTVAEHYLIKGGVKPAELEQIDYERLYLSAKTGGTVEQQLAKATTLTRSELKAERNDDDPHEHEAIKICRICQIRL